MASLTKREDRLDALFADVERLRVAVLDREREAGELLGDDEAAAAARWNADAARLLLDAAKDRYIAESEASRHVGCVVHGEAIYVSCPDCMARLPKKKAA